MQEGEEIIYRVPAKFNRVRADKVLPDGCPGLSRTRLQKLFEAGLVWMDDEVITRRRKVSTGDCISFRIPPPKTANLEPAAIPLDIIHEDEAMLAVNKPSGMVVHPGHGTGNDTLVHALLHHCAGKLSGISGAERPGIVHRLDKETSGVIVAAKTDAAFLHLSKCFAERRIGKEYLALCRGVPQLQSGIIEEPIGRHPANRVKMAVRARGRYAWTAWELLESCGREMSLLRIRIRTGRTHQIRVHLAHRGFPLMGDSLYGKTDRAIFKRTFLHARTLTLEHPESGKQLILKAKLPDDFSDLLTRFSFSRRS